MIPLWHPDFSDSIDYTVRVVKMILEKPLPWQTMLSLNVPKTKPKGLKVCPMTVGRFVEEFVHSEDGKGKRIHWLTGRQDPAEDTKEADWHYLKEWLGDAHASPARLHELSVARGTRSPGRTISIALCATS